MFSAENMLRYTNNSPNPVSHHTTLQKPITKKISNKSLEIFFPSEKDQLFWCFYIILNGIDRYEMIKKSIFKTEKEFKIEAVEKLRSKDDIKAIFKINKLKKTEIENQLVNMQCIKIEALRALCILYEISIIYVRERTYSLFNHGTSISAVIIEKNHKYGFQIENLSKYVEQIKTNLFCIEDITKPIKGIATYTIKDLQDIATKFELPILDKTGKKFVKKLLYESILTKL
tara:strand:+ start:1444 stop:2133 length:690 start_codon:yes stop_codon:yes gene_type:complete